VIKEETKSNRKITLIKCFNEIIAFPLFDIEFIIFMLRQGLFN